MKSRLPHDRIRNHIECSYPKEYKLVVEGGKLVGDWSNVARHCFLQAVIAEALSNLLGLTVISRRRLAKTAACHDWDKRLEKNPLDFSLAEMKSARIMERKARINRQLLAACTPPFIPYVLEGRASFLQLVQFYIDDIVLNDEIVPTIVRIEKTQQLNPEPSKKASAALEKFDKKYWETESEICQRVEAMLLSIIRARYIPVNKLDDLLKFLHDYISLL